LSRFRKLSESLAYRGSLITAGRATYEGPSGDRFDRDIVHHPGAVVVVPVLDGGSTVLMVRQYRAAVDRVLLEVPAGKRDVTDEPVESTARRELAEEVGMVAGSLHLLAEFYNSPGFCDEHSWLFLATDLTPCPSSAQGVEEEHMTLERVAFEAVDGLVADGELVDAKSLLGLCLARRALRSITGGT